MPQMVRAMAPMRIERAIVAQSVRAKVMNFLPSYVFEFLHKNLASIYFLLQVFLATLVAVSYVVFSGSREFLFFQSGIRNIACRLSLLTHIVRKT